MRNFVAINRVMQMMVMYMCSMCRFLRTFVSEENFSMAMSQC